MDIKEMQTKKAQVEKDISDLLNTFCRDCGVMVWHLNADASEITRLEDVSRRYHYEAHVTVKL